MCETAANGIVSDASSGLRLRLGRNNCGDETQVEKGCPWMGGSGPWAWAPAMGNNRSLRDHYELCVAGVFNDVARAGGRLQWCPRGFQGQLCFQLTSGGCSLTSANSLRDFCGEKRREAL